MKKSLVAIVAGGFAYFLLGGLFYGVLLGDFYASNQGSATGVMRELPVMWALVVSQLGLAALVTYVFIHMGVDSALSGLKAGAIFGFLFGFAISLDLYSVTNWSNVTVALIEPLVTGARIALGGAVIGQILGIGKNT